MKYLIIVCGKKSIASCKISKCYKNSFVRNYPIYQTIVTLMNEEIIAVQNSTKKDIKNQTKLLKIYFRFI